MLNGAAAITGAVFLMVLRRGGWPQGRPAAEEGTEWERKTARARLVKQMFLPSFCSPSYSVRSCWMCAAVRRCLIGSGLAVMRGSHLVVNGRVRGKRSHISVFACVCPASALCMSDTDTPSHLCVFVCVCLARILTFVCLLANGLCLGENDIYSCCGLSFFFLVCVCVSLGLCPVVCVCVSCLHTCLSPVWMLSQAVTGGKVFIWTLSREPAEAVQLSVAIPCASGDTPGAAQLSLSLIYYVFPLF